MSSTAPPAEVTAGAASTVLAVLQRVGRSLIMPIVVLPPAALLLRLGQTRPARSQRARLARRDRRRHLGQRPGHLRRPAVVVRSRRGDWVRPAI